MFSPLLVAYLFLAGTGCGVFVFSVFLAWRAKAVSDLVKSLGRIAFPALVASCGLVVVGSICLLLDLGRPELAMTVLLSTEGSVLTVGAWALVAFSALAVVLLVCNLGILPLPRAGVVAVEAAGCILAVVVMVYSGLFLSTIWTLPFLASPMVPILFLCSSLSCGGGVLLILPLFCDVEKNALFHEISRVDGVLLAVEAAVLTAFLVIAQGDPLSARAALRLISGDFALLFWGGLVVVGLAVPFVLEIAFRKGGARLYAGVGIFLLVGGFALRYCFCFAPFVGVSAYL